MGRKCPRPLKQGSQSRMRKVQSLFMDCGVKSHWGGGAGGVHWAFSVCLCGDKEGERQKGRGGWSELLGAAASGLGSLVHVQEAAMLVTLSPTFATLHIFFILSRRDECKKNPKSSTVSFIKSNYATESLKMQPTFPRAILMSRSLAC